MTQYPDADQYDLGLENYNWLMEQVILHEATQAVALGILLHEKFSPRTVIDIGTGPGIYLLPFRKRGSKILGIDGAPAAGECLRPEEFKLVDLRQPWTPPYEFDLSLCIEVAEHIRPEYESVLMDTVCKCAPQVFWTAARPNQGGEGHHNEQTKEYWIEKFAQRGFVVHPRNDEVFSRIYPEEAYDHCHWIKWNGIMFQRK